MLSWCVGLTKYLTSSLMERRDVYCSWKYTLQGENNVRSQRHTLPPPARVVDHLRANTMARSMSKSSEIRSPR